MIFTYYLPCHLKVVTFWVTRKIMNFSLDIKSEIAKIARHRQLIKFEKIFTNIIEINYNFVIHSIYRTLVARHRQPILNLHRQVSNLVFTVGRLVVLHYNVKRWSGDGGGCWLMDSFDISRVKWSFCEIKIN